MSTLTKRKKPITRKKKLPQLSEKEKEEELLRKLERNRMAFEAWLDKKKEEAAGRREAKQKAAHLELERQEQRRIVGKLAYQRWLKNKQDEDELLKKEKVLEKEVKKLKMAEKEEEKYRAQETFRSWKRQKALEMKLQRQLEGEETRACSPTPKEPTATLPGYCSVWSCDEELAEFMLDKVKRGPPLLSDVQNYNNNSADQNVTVCHNPG